MMPPRHEQDHRLRRALRDVVALSALPFVWLPYTPARVVDDLADVLLHIACVELLFLRVVTDVETLTVTKARRDGAADDVRTAAAIEAVLATGDRSPLIRADPLQPGRALYWAVFPLSDDPAEVLVAASAAADFPTELDRLMLTLGPNLAEVVLRKQTVERLRAENVLLRDALEENLLMGAVIGSSPPIREVMRAVESVAPTDTTVLITGETGTGKELIAREIHRRSRRASGPLIAVNCAALPPSLIASELFGHERGAFTGALQRRIGRFELAAKGTIFLDEIGELPPETQVMLLRVLQERVFERVGGSTPVRVDVRVIAATNRDLTARMAEGSFRADLFYRLNVFPIHVPPLRDRREDIPLLAQHFAQIFARRLGKKITHISAAGLRRLTEYAWPGNVRELENVIERAVILNSDTTLDVRSSLFPKNVPAAGGALTGRIDDLERSAIEEALAATRGRVAGPRGAAARLGLPATTLHSKMIKYGLDASRFKQ
jgi:transcriptional regulator with GAF, ATPase, and Fis domain